MNLGVSYDSDVGKAVISLFQNEPTTREKLDFTVEFLLEHDNGDGCKYSDGFWYRTASHVKSTERSCDVS